MGDRETGRGEMKNRELQTENQRLIDELLMAESWGDVQGKWVPAIKEAVTLGEMEKLLKLRAKFPYSFENALNYLRREEREVIRKECRRDT
ncbi:hypothetical protein [Paenibacillus typhae]|uniref:hypothetical protein n=1 Tax=Paenibacillus typhae TaxID=1174501 RepID=UPI001C8E2EE0|nr:hypothetical protein [Paenibacillus typhae]MBY0010798.1 hypothetical protein [Paenibacillus typhae]